MNVVRPPGGFNIVVKPEVQAYIDAETRDNFRVGQFWLDILERLKITGLKEGDQVPRTTRPRFTFIADGAPDFNLPTIKIGYECFADTLTVIGALVYQDEDYEDGGRM
jgi:hypothetical protein